MSGLSATAVSTHGMQNFTPGPAALGGMLIGLAAALLWIANGRIAGISGIVGGLLFPARGDAGSRVAFLAGMIAAPLLLAAATREPAIVVQAAPLTLAAGGFSSSGSAPASAAAAPAGTACADRAALAPLDRGDRHLHGRRRRDRLRGAPRHRRRLMTRPAAGRGR